jgi:hypothetical protein
MAVHCLAAAAAVFVSTLCSLCPRIARAGDQPVELRGERWTITVHPETLGVEARLADGGATLVISSPNETPAQVERLESNNRKASWALLHEHAGVGVSMRLESDVLVVDFTGTSPGSFTWPVITRDAKPRAYVLPMFEGLYVPADDHEWGTFLARESPMNTTAGLSMPFWGVDAGNGRSLTYILTNPFNNEITFTQDSSGLLGLKLAHEFTRNEQRKAFGYRIHLGDGSPVTPARLYRQRLIDTKQFVSMKQKIERTPDAAKLLGAAHIYLWGDGLITRGDVKDYKKLAAALLKAAGAPEDSVPKRVVARMDAESRKVLDAIPAAAFVDKFQKGVLVNELSRILKMRDLVEPAPAGDAHDLAVAKSNCAAFYAACSDALNPPETWGDGFSPKMVDLLAAGGIERAWLGSPSWDGLKYHPEFTKAAIDNGYLVGPYDSYHSIHPRDAKDTWETAQFADASLYDAGAIVNADGSMRKGFKQKGHLLSPIAARPHVEQRVEALMNVFRCNSWFIDCDAFGEVFDDYAPAHPATQASDTAERLSRMAWIRDTYHAVIGSEGGSGYAAPVIHFAHGMMTPVVAWGDPDLMKNKQSKYYLGAYYPPDEPAIVFRQVPMKAEHRRIYADPKFRLPLYQTVFHDSVVATHEWGYGTLKFEDPGRTRELLELLYNVPPLYHLNQAEWAKRKDEITAHLAFFAPLHKDVGLLPMTGFEWLTDDRMVQRTTFGDRLELTANFGDAVYHGGGVDVPPHAIVARHVPGGETATYPAHSP